MRIEPKSDRPVERSRLELLMLLGGAGASAACLGGPAEVYSQQARRAPAATAEKGERAGGEGGGGEGGGSH